MQPERVFEKRIAQLAAEREADNYLHGPAGGGLAPVERPAGVLRTDVGPAHEFVLVVRGKARVATPGQVFELRPNDLLLVDPGVRHGELPADPPCSYEMFWCELHRTHVLMGHTLFSLSRRWRLGPTLELHGRSHLQNVAEAISSELSFRQWGWERSVASLLNYLACLMMRRLHADRPVRRLPSEPPTIYQDARVSRTIQGVIKYCRANLQETLRLEEIAAAVGYSPSHVSHSFTRQLGRTVSECVRELRLSAAREMLLDTDLPIGEVARAIGYSDPSHFTRAFTRTYQLSPRAYRRRLRAC